MVNNGEVEFKSDWFLRAYLQYWNRSILNHSQVLSEKLDCNYGTDKTSNSQVHSVVLLPGMVNAEGELKSDWFLKAYLQYYNRLILNHSQVLSEVLIIWNFQWRG